MLYKKDGVDYAGESIRDIAAAQNISMAVSPSTADFIELGYLPVIEIRPSITETQRHTTYTDNVFPDRIERVYNVENIPVEDVAVSLENARKDKRLQLNMSRLAANTSTFPYGGKLIACDALSRSDIDGVLGFALRGSLPAGFPGVWKATDNTYVPIPDAATFLLMFDAMVAQGVTNFLHSEQKKAELAAAETLAEIAAIQW